MADADFSKFFGSPQNASSELTNSFVAKGELPESQRENISQQGEDFSQFMKPLNPDEGQFGTKSKLLLGNKPRSRLTAAKEAFTGTLKAGGKRLKRAAQGFSQGGNIFSKPDASLALLGGLGDVALSPFAAGFGLAEPEIAKGVSFVSKKIPEPVKKKASELIAAVPPDMKETLGDAFSAAGLLALSPTKSFGKAALRKAPRPVIRQVGKTGKALEKSGIKAAQAQQQSFIRDLIRPVQTKKVKEAQVARTTETGRGIFKRSIIEPTKKELAAERAVLEIKDLKPGATQQQSFNTISKANLKEARNLEQAIAKNDFIFPKKELNARLKEAKTRLMESPTLTGDAQKTAQKIMDKFQQFVDEQGATGSGLLKARKKLDNWIKSQKPKAFDPNKEGAFEIALREVRQTANKFLDEKATSVKVKESLAKQSSLFDALENIKPKAAIEADTAVGRVLQRAGKILGTKNRAVQATAAAVGIGGLGAAATFAPTAAALIGTGFALRGLTKLALSPGVRKALGRMLKEIERQALTTTNKTKSVQLQSLKKNIDNLIKDKRGAAQIGGGFEGIPKKVPKKFDSFTQARIDKAMTAAPDLKAFKETFSWGDLVQVKFGKKGISGRAILHPEHQTLLKSMKIGGSSNFVDEQGIKWIVDKISKDKFSLTAASPGRGHKGIVNLKDILESKKPNLKSGIVSTKVAKIGDKVKKGKKEFEVIAVDYPIDDTLQVISKKDYKFVKDQATDNIFDAANIDPKVQKLFDPDGHGFKSKAAEKKFNKLIEDETQDLLFDQFGYLIEDMPR